MAQPLERSNSLAVTDGYPCSRTDSRVLDKPLKKLHDPAFRNPGVSAMSFPVFDLAAFERSDGNGKRQMGREVDLICRASGFLAVRNHGIPDEVSSQVWQAAHDFVDLSP